MALIAVLSAWRLLGAWMLWSRGLKAQATIVELKPMVDDGYHPVVRFQDASGKVRLVPLWISGLNYKVGDRLNVVYSPGAPDKAQLAEPIQFILPALGLIAAVYVGFRLLVDGV